MDKLIKVPTRKRDLHRGLFNQRLALLGINADMLSQHSIRDIRAMARANFRRNIKALHPDTGGPCHDRARLFRRTVNAWKWFQGTPDWIFTRYSLENLEMLLRQEIIGDSTLLPWHWK